MGIEIDFLAVGEEARSGDAIALRYGNLFGDRSEQRIVVIDGGDPSSGRALVDLIRTRYGTDRVDLALSSHPDRHHLGGLAIVLEELSVTELWMHQPWNHSPELDVARRAGFDGAGLSVALREALKAAAELEPVRFVNLQSAVLAARRMQWALDGLAENASTDRVAACIAIHPDKDLDSGAVAAILENLMPGRVVLNTSVAEAVRQLPGMSVRETSDANWRELRWQGADAPSGLSDDEQSVLGMIRALGREDPCPPRATPVAPPPPVTGGFQAPEGLGRSVLDPEPAAGSGKMKWLILGGAAAIVIAFAALLIPGIVSGNHAKTQAPPPDTSTKTTAPSTPVTPPVVTSPVPVATDKPKPSPKPGKQPKPEAKPDQNPPKITGSCDLTEADIPRSLERARKYMYDGNLPAAQAMFQRLVPCPTVHDQAQAGLNSVRQRMAVGPQ